jgi:hypothetical protein
MQPRTEAFRQFQYPTVPLAVYPQEAVSGHRAFIARRRELRPSAARTFFPRRRNCASSVTDSAECR